MFQLLTIVALVFAQENSKIEELLIFTGEIKIEKVEETSDFSENKVAIHELEGEEALDYAGEINEKEVAEILDQDKIEVEPTQSLQGVIEKETAQVLQEAQKEDSFEGIDPVTEDLALFVKQPTVTISEPIQDQPQESYEQLPITQEEKQKIANILTTMAENNVFKLLFEKKRLERLGHEVNHVHPVRFLGTVFNDPRLVYCMHRIRSSGFKWGGFIDGFSQRFKQELNAGNVNAFIPGLAETLNIPASDIQGYIDHSDIEGLIIFLMEKSRHKS